MKNINAMALALEQLEEETQEIIETPAAPEVTSDDVAQSTEEVNALTAEASDVDDDVEALVNASAGLESLAETMTDSGFEEAGEDETLTNLELAGVNSALEAVGEQPAAAGDSKASVLQRVKEGGKKAWEWLMSVVSKATTWIVDTFNRLFRPLETYRGRLGKLSGATFNTIEVPEGIQRRLAGVGDLVTALGDYTKLLGAVKTAEPVAVADKVIEALKSGKDTAAVRAEFVKLRQKYSGVYNVKREGGWAATKEYAGGVSFELLATEDSFDHRENTNKEAAFKAKLIDSASIAKISNEAGNLYGAIKDALNKDGAPSMLKGLNARVKALVGANRQMTAEAKALSYIVPKLIKGPGISIALQATGTLGAVVKLAELQAKPAKEAKAAKAA